MENLRVFVWSSPKRKGKLNSTLVMNVFTIPEE
jgi:hypothetical protein